MRKIFKKKIAIYSILHFTLFGLFLIGTVSLLFYIFLTYPIIFHSDSAAFVALAKERIDTSSFFPKDWRYSTGIMLFNPSLLIPLFKPLFGYSILSRSFSVLIFIFILFYILSLLLKNQESKFGYYIALILLISAGSSSFAEYMFGQASYLSGACMMVMGLLLTRDLLALPQNYFPKHLLKWLILSIIIFLMSFQGFSGYFCYILPFLVSLIAIELIDLWKINKSPGVNNSGNWQNRIVLICIFLLLSTAGILCYLKFTSIYETGMGKPVTFVTADNYMQNLRMLFDQLKFISGVTLTGHGYYFPFGNILQVYRFIILIGLLFVVPIFMVFRFSIIESRFDKYLALYQLNTLIAITAACIFTDVVENVLSSRYFIFPIFLSFIVFAIFINYYLKNRPKQILFIVILLIPYLISSYLQMNFPYGYIEKKKNEFSIRKNKNYRADLTSFLMKEGLSFGFATFWNAGVISCLSNWHVQVCPIQIENGLPRHRYWLSSKRWYEVSYHPKETFLLFDKGETVDTKLLKLFLGEAHNKIRYGRYTILVYDSNIADRIIGWPSFSVKRVNIPDFYYQLAKEKEDFAILELPFNKDENQIYQLYQTIHKKKLLFGDMSRIPDEQSERFRIDRITESLFFPHLVQNTENVLKHHFEFDNFLYFQNVKYIIIHKCLTNAMVFDKLDSIVSYGLAFPKIYEDNDIKVYRTKKISPNKIVKYKDRGWSKYEELLVFDFSANEENADVLLNGFYNPEACRGNPNNMFRWSSGERSSLTFKLIRPEKYTFHLFIRPFEAGAVYAKEVDLYINQKYHSTIHLRRPELMIPFDEYRVETDREFWKSGINEIEFRYRNTFKPGNFFGYKDECQVALAFYRLQLKRTNIDYNWSNGKTSGIILKIPTDHKDKDYVMNLGILPFKASNPSKKQTIHISINQKLLGNLSLADDFRIYQIFIPHIYLKPGNNHINFQYAYVNEDKQIDNRRLGVALYYLEFNPQEDNNLYPIQEYLSGYNQCVKFKEGWQLALNSSKDSYEWETKSSGVIALQCPEKKSYVKIDGYVNFPSGISKLYVTFYVDGIRKERFTVKTNGEHFTCHYALDIKDRNEIPLRMEITPTLSKGTGSRLVIQKVDLIKKADLPLYYFAHGWSDVEILPGPFQKKVDNQATIYLRNVHSDVLVKMRGVANLKNPPLDGITIFFNGEQLDRINIGSSRKPFVSDYLIREEEFSDIPWGKLDIKVEAPFSPDEDNNTRDILIEEFDALSMNQDVVFGKGWFPDKWIEKNAICYMRNLKAGTRIKVEGKTAIKFFKQPLTVYIYLADRKLDEFTLENSLISRIKMKLGGKLFSNMYTVDDKIGSSEWEKLRITSDQSFVPDEVLSNGDKRHVSLLISDIQIMQ